MTIATTGDTLWRTTYDSPVGQLTLVGSERGLRAILWPNERAGRVEFEREVVPGRLAVFDAVAAQLDEYFVGDRQVFDVPLDVVGTDFQRDVWEQLDAIPFGETRSYGQVADRMGRPGAARAVGAATGLNPLSILIPCHRLVGANGSLTGFAGGIDSKRWLLDHESDAQGLPFAKDTERTHLDG